MSLQWFPGHMAKARRELAELMPSQDVLIEVLDARMPASSHNPLVTELWGARPRIEVLTKSDLADPAVTSAWLRALESASPADEASGAVFAIAVSSDSPRETRARIAELSERVGGRRGKKVRALIAGIPNVGKSTLINTLMNRTVAVVSDRPAVTREQQRVVLPTGMVVTDSPGLMSPKIEDESVALRLAFGGAIPATAVDYERMAGSVAPHLLAHYAPLLEARFKLGAIPEGPEALLEAIGRRRGFLRAGGVVDTHKAAEVLVHEFRAGRLGRISLESPEL
ncbi:MAG: ribosome biogenesis GTPase YlqF [Myxococcota bacterium]|nr:ribosome biogenesis GTPase YlqF [Myxococcota bacterium]